MRNPLSMDEVFGIDIKEDIDLNIFAADLTIESIPFKDNYFDCISAYDFIEHIPRIVYAPKRRFSFVELMNEIYRTLKLGGVFYSSTPAFPAAPAWRDPTHVNIITEETFPLYFDDKNRLAEIYGFNGYFKLVEQRWHENKVHLITIMEKIAIPV